MKEGGEPEGESCRGQLSPSGWYLMIIASLSSCTEILRFVETLQRVSKSAEVGS